MEKPVVTRFFTQKGDVLDFEIQRGNKRLLGAIVIASGIFKLEHCSFDLAEAIDELKVVHAVVWHVYESNR